MNCKLCVREFKFSNKASSVVLPLDIVYYFPTKMRQERKCFLEVNNIQSEELSVINMYFHPNSYVHFEV